jgi:hypothetical protein
MHIELKYAHRRSTPICCVATALLLTLAACSHWGDTRKADPDKNAPRAQLSIGQFGGHDKRSNGELSSVPH